MNCSEKDVLSSHNKSDTSGIKFLKIALGNTIMWCLHTYDKCLLKQTNETEYALKCCISILDWGQKQKVQKKNKVWCTTRLKHFTCILRLWQELTIKFILLFAIY